MPTAADSFTHTYCTGCAGDREVYRPLPGGMHEIIPCPRCRPGDDGLDHEGDIMDPKDRIEAAIKPHGLTVREWRKDEDDENMPAAFLGRFRVIEEDEDRGLYDGDEGELVASIVGAAEYHNQRVHFGFTADGLDSPNEVVDLSIIEEV